MTDGVDKNPGEGDDQKGDERTLGAGEQAKPEAGATDAFDARSVWRTIAATVIAVVLLVIVLVLQALLPPAVADNDIFRTGSVVAICLVAASLLFGVISGSTGYFRISTGPALAIGLTGAAGGFAAFFWLVENRL